MCSFHSLSAQFSVVIFFHIFDTIPPRSQTISQWVKINVQRLQWISILLGQQANKPTYPFSSRQINSLFATISLNVTCLTLHGKSFQSIRNGNPIFRFGFPHSVIDEKGITSSVENETFAHILNASLALCWSKVIECVVPFVDLRRFFFHSPLKLNIHIYSELSSSKFDILLNEKKKRKKRGGYWWKCDQNKAKICGVCEHVVKLSILLLLLSPLLKIELLFCDGPHAVDKTQCVTELKKINEISFSAHFVNCVTQTDRFQFLFEKLFHRKMQSIWFAGLAVYCNLDGFHFRHSELWYF